MDDDAEDESKEEAEGERRREEPKELACEVQKNAHKAQVV